MKKTFKAALLGVLGLFSVTAAQAIVYNGDLLVGFTKGSGTDLVYDLGSEASITNGQTWNLSSALTAAGLNSSLSTVNWGVVGDINSSGTKYSWLTFTGGTPAPDSSSSFWSYIHGADANLVINDFSATGMGNYATPAESASYSWGVGVGNSFSVGTGSESGNYTAQSQNYPNQVGLGSIAFWQQIANNSTPVQLGSFTLNNSGVLTYNTLSVSASTNAYLTSLILSPAGLTSTFVSNTFSYLATNAYGNSPTVTVVNADLTATNILIYNSTTNALTSGSASSGLALTLGVTNVAQVQVTAQDGVTVYTYQVNIVEQPSLTVPHLTNSMSGGTNLVLSWPADHLGYRLLMQTNNLAKGVSGVATDWGTVPGSTNITSTNITIIKTGVTNQYYRLVYP
jgi:hypothetical protein